MQGDAISRKLDLSLSERGGKRNRDELRKLLQMGDCLSIGILLGRQPESEIHSVRNYGSRSKQGKFRKP